jgi:hypothetical protein
MRASLLLVIGLALGACGGDDDMATGDSCGGFAGATCGDEAYCDFPSDECAAADGVGTCTARPTVCTPIIQVVCGCDGKRYNNACEAQRAGTDVSGSTECE